MDGEAVDHPARALEFLVHGGGVSMPVITARRMCQAVSELLAEVDRVDVTCLNTGDEVQVEQVMDGVVIAVRSDMPDFGDVDEIPFWGVVLRKWIAYERTGCGPAGEGPADRG